MKKIDKILNIIKSSNKNIIIYNDIDNNIKLEKENNNKTIKSKEFIKKNKEFKNNINKEIDKLYLKYIHDFLNILTTNLSHCNFDNLNKNIESLKFNEVKTNKLQGFNISFASYYVKDNSIRINRKNFMKYINHELLHMASRRRISNDLIIAGFCSISFKYYLKFGIFLNEGYTEYLINKYFNNSDIYKTHRRIIYFLELIIGEKLMEQMYFNADINGLINELVKYNNTEEEVINFIINTDIINKNLYAINPLKRKKLKKSLIEVNKFLIKTYFDKLKNNKIRNKQNLLDTFIYNLTNTEIDFFNNERYIDNKFNTEIKKKLLNK